MRTAAGHGCRGRGKVAAAVGRTERIGWLNQTAPRRFRYGHRAEARHRSKRKKNTSAIRRNRRTKWRNEDLPVTAWRKREGWRWKAASVGHKKNGDSIFRYISAPTQKELSAKLRQLTEAHKGVDLTEESTYSSGWTNGWTSTWPLRFVPPPQRLSPLSELHVKPYLGNKLSQNHRCRPAVASPHLQETGRVHPRDGQSPRPFRQNGPRHPIPRMLAMEN